MKEIDYSTIIEMRQNGATLREISSAVDYDLSGISKLLRIWGVKKGPRPNKELQKPEQKKPRYSTPPKTGRDNANFLSDQAVAEKIFLSAPNFEYIGGYNGSKGKIDIKCKVCGAVYSRMYAGVRKGKAVCKNCKRNVSQQIKVAAKLAKVEEKAKWPYKQTEAEIAAIVSERLPGFEYVGGYTGSDGFADIRCLTCGLIFKRSFVSIRHGKGRCPACYEKELLAQKAEREAQRQAEAAERERIRKEQAEIRRLAKIKPALRIVCAECGQTFETTDSKRVYCSPECYKHRQNRKTDRRLKRYGQKENGITLRRLYKRDAGVCYLCGRTCDWNDKTTDENGTIICGDNYPSIEHVIPLSLGGPNDWDNVRLACRGCNNAKHTHSDVKICANGQLALNF